MERVEAWTVSQAADLLSATSISADPTTAPPLPAEAPRETQPRGTTVTLSIPLDDHAVPPTTPPRQAAAPRHAATTPPHEPGAAVHTVHKRRTPIRRDSLARREALLKGKEGSRQRRRWENDRLLSNPYAEPPLPSDWEAKPTYPVRKVPYFLAPLWDAEFARVSAERELKRRKGKVASDKRKVGVEGEAEEEEVALRVAAELRARLKKARGARGLLQDLEEEVRGFVEEWEDRQKALAEEGLLEDGESSEDDEIVFVGRGGVTLDERRKREGLDKDKLVFQSSVEDQGAAFGRYLVHSIAEYYGLRTWSKTTGNPARREAYVGLKTDPKTRRPSLTHSHLPRPLWTVV